MTDDTKIGIKAFVILLAVFIIVYFSGIASFETNDDLAVISILKGYFGWQPNISPFLAPVLSMIFMQLYDFDSVVPWFGLLQYLIMFVGAYWDLKILLSTYWSWLTKVTLSMIFLSLLLYIVIQPNFGATSLFAGFMAAVYVTYLNLKGKGFWLSYLLVGIMLLLAYMFKTVNTWIILPIIFPMFFTFLLSSDTRRKFFVVLIPVIIVFVASFIINSHVLDHYDSVQTTRSLFFSIHFGDMSKNIDNLNAAGWNMDDYYVSRTWFTHDQSIFGLDQMSQFLYYDVFNNLIPDIASQIPVHLMETVHRSMSFLIILIFGLIIILDSDRKPFEFKLQIKRSWIKWFTLLSLVTMIGGFVALFLYRFPPRVFIPLFLYVLIVVLLARTLIIVDRKTLFANIRRALLGGCLCLTVLFLIIQIGEYRNLFATKTMYQNEADASISTMKTLLGEDTIFLEGAGAAATFVSTSPFKETLGVNYILVPLGWVINTPTYYDFLNRYDISESDIVNFSLDNPRVIYSFYCLGQDSVDIFERHFNRHYGDAKSMKFEVVKDFRSSDLEANFLYMRLVSER